MLLVNDTRIRKYRRPTLLGNLSQLLQDSISCGIVLVADFFFFLMLFRHQCQKGVRYVAEIVLQLDFDCLVYI